MRALAALLVLPLAACGSSAGGGDCETIGMTHAGSMTATTPDGPFTAECLTVATIGDYLTVTAVESTSALQGVQPRTISVGIKGDTTGTYFSESAASPGRPVSANVSYEPGGSGAERVNYGEAAVVVLGAGSQLRGGFSYEGTDGRGNLTGKAVEGDFEVSLDP